MSRVLTVDGEHVQFILNDSEDLNTEGLSDIIYSDGTRAILVNGNGQIIQSDTQTVVLQDDDFNQYYINDESGEILVTEEQDNPVAQSLDDSEVVQFIEEDGSVIGPPQVIYVNEEGYPINDSELSQYQIAEIQDSESTMPSKTIKLEQVVDLEELLRQQGESEAAIIDDSSDTNGYQYAILKDGKLHIQSYNGDIFPVATTDVLEEQTGDVQETDKQDFDLSKITGRNLLTGQTVCLHNYMDKLQKKIKESKARDFETGQKRRASGAPPGLKALLNKKLPLGKTSNGKRLVGKVIYVEKQKKEESSGVLGETIAPTVEDCPPVEDVKLNHGDLQLGNMEEEDTLGFDDSGLTLLPDADLSPKPAEKPTPPPRPASKKRVLVQEKLVSKECIEHICRTLSGLMNMDTVKKKLQYKNIIVKVVERKFNEATGGYTKKVSYSSGHMREEFIVNDEGEMLENWSFVLDENVKASILGPGEEDGQDGGSQYSDTTNVTVVITYEKNNYRAIRVILNPTNAIRCAECSKEFSTNVQLKVHVLNTHAARPRGRRARPCEVCGLQLAEQEMREHCNAHVDEGKMLRCPVTDCRKFFLTAGRLRRHEALHSAELNPFECSICARKYLSELGLKRHLMTAHMNAKHFICETCGKGFTNPGDLNFHKRTHGPYKYYECDICKRTFSRHSNLQRHIEIHRGSEELYQCTICGCSYHYMSSLTRHVVQNHIKRSDEETPPVLVENDNEGV